MSSRRRACFSRPTHGASTQPTGGGLSTAPVTGGQNGLFKVRPEGHNGRKVYAPLSPAPFPDLIPSKSYGTLIPYIGDEVRTVMGYDSPVYGFVTSGGMVVDGCRVSGPSTRPKITGATHRFRCISYQNSRMTARSRMAPPEKCGMPRAHRTAAGSRRLIMCGAEICDKVLLLFRTDDGASFDAYDDSGRAALSKEWNRVDHAGFGLSGRLCGRTATRR